MKTWDGTLSSSEFCAASCAFSDLWNRFNSFLAQWSWVPCPKRSWISQNKMEGYLSVENMILPMLLAKDDQTEKEDCSCEDEDDSIDPAKLVQNHDPEVYRFDFHVVYSSSYRVPVLYFRAYHSDGQPLALEDIQKEIQFYSVQLLTKSRWTFITQEEHPILKRPWYTLHPCGTSEWMKLLMNNKTSIAQGGIEVEKYLVSWFSVVGQVFGIKIPLEMVNFVGTC